jgi:hypothetical protein
LNEKVLVAAAAVQADAVIFARRNQTKTVFASIVKFVPSKFE